MRHWLQLATRNWRTRPARSCLAVLSIALGVGVVVWVTCCYESVRQSMTELVLQWIGRSHVVVENKRGVWGVFEEDIEGPLSDVPGIAHTTTRTREYVEVAALPSDDPADAERADFVTIEITGVNPKEEPAFRTYRLAEGRFLLPDDEDAIIVERLLAREFGLGLGDTILIRRKVPPRPARRFEVVGIVDRRRASANQAMMTWARLSAVQEIVELPGKIKAVDIILAEPTVENIQRVANDIRMIVKRHNERREAAGQPTEPLIVKTTEAQHKKLGAAQGLLQFIMMLLSCVVLLTAFFIILATMSMGVTERITELGLLRCVGVTRRQLGGLLLLQTLPLGVVGTLIGLPLGMFLQWLTMLSAPDYVGRLALNHWGIALAVGGGVGTTLLGTAIPALGSFSISPVDAARAHAGGRLLRWVWITAAAGVMLIVAGELVRRSMSAGAAIFDVQAVSSLMLLYGGAALTAPAVVVLLGRLIVHVAALMLRLRPQLLGEEISKAPFRSAAVCSALMVGLSLIVGLIVWGDSVKQGWQFPREFPDAMLYCYDPLLPLDEVRDACRRDGIGEFTVTDDFGFLLNRPKKNRLLRKLQELGSLNRFLAIDPSTGFAIIKLTFLEGDQREATAKLEQGDHILVTREFAQARGKHLGDEVSLWVEVTREFAQARDKHVGDEVSLWVETTEGAYTEAAFTIAGVIASPGIDIAVSFFNASTYFQSYAVGTVFGTLDDAKRLFGRSFGRLMLFNFDIEDDGLGSDGDRIVSDTSQAVVPKTRTTSIGRPTFDSGPGPIPGDGPEERIVNGILRQLDYPAKAFVTTRELEGEIDHKINRVTLLLSAIPAVGLIIAAMGVANLMAAGVAARSRQTAILRAVGVTKGQMARIVIGEALVIGLLGSVMGLALGFLLGRMSNAMTQVISGFHPDFSIPWPKVCLGATLATLLCLIAALVPAHHASRSNIIAALSD